MWRVGHEHVPGFARAYGVALPCDFDENVFLHEMHSVVRLALRREKHGFARTIGLEDVRTKGPRENGAITVGKTALGTALGRVHPPNLASSGRESTARTGRTAEV